MEEAKRVNATMAANKEARDERGRSPGDQTRTEGTCGTHAHESGNHEPNFPIVDMDILRAYLRSRDAPRVLVAFEFSGSLREALAKRGVKAISADERESQAEGPHFQGEVRDIMPLRQWEAVYCVGPNCFQTLRADRDCLEYKIKDGRAYWGAATVLWCLCQPNADMILVEQPDTITVDFLPPMQEHGVEVMELRTSQYGDMEDKFMRLTTRNMIIPRPTQPPIVRERKRRTQFAYQDPEERDRARSTWRNYPLMCQAIAQATAKQRRPPPAPDYRWAVEEMAQAWHRAGYPVPHDYANEDARPTTTTDRKYQKVRGKGHKGMLDGVTPRGILPAMTMEGPRETEDPGARQKEEIELRLEDADDAKDMVVPVTLQEGEVIALVPSRETEVLTTARSSTGRRPTIDQAEDATRNTVGDEVQVMGYRAANAPDGKQITVTVCDGKGQHPVANTASQRRSLATKAAKGLLWCTLAALATGQPQTNWTQLAMCSANQFMMHREGTFSTLLQEATMQRQLGATPGRGPTMGPKYQMYHDAQTITPRDLVTRADEATRELRRKLLLGEGPMGAYLAEWADTIRPLDLAEVPTELMDKPLSLESMGVADQLFAERLPIYELPWLPRMPPQRHTAGCEAYRPRSARDLLSQRAVREIESWMKKAKVDLRCLEEKGAECEREDRPKLLALGQEHLQACAKGKVWDCRRRGTCKLLDYQAPIRTALNIPRLKELFRNYPDQRLASNVIEGVRLEADIEHQIVLHPNLVTVGEGYDSVQKTVRELAKMGFYEMHAELPYVPIVITGQGSRIKKLGIKKYRRTSDFSAPHKETKDSDGQPVVAINDASRCYHLPKWLREADADVKSWDRDRHEHVQWTSAEDREAPVRFKFPKELKPKLSHIMNDAAILLKASMEMEESLFVWVEDAAYYFNQFAYAPEELWKSNLVIGARAGDETQDGELLEPHHPTIVAENRLGFGSFASSNIAQRFSNALVHWTLQDFDNREEEARIQEANPRWEKWRADRAPLERQCTLERPKRRGQAATDCTQTRLAVMHMYTDDPIVMVVGADRTLRLLQAWHHVTGGAGVQMAGAEKRQMGGQVEWIGITVLAAIGLVVVPRTKLLRAREGVVRALKGEMTFGEYRALIGLLEHLRFIAQLEADATNALYKPHGKHGASAFGPSAIVTPDQLMIHKLDKWVSIIMTCAGATVTLIFTESAATNWRAAHDAYVASADAAGDGKGSPGLGGYMHGFWWRVPLAHVVLKAMHITAWETMATAINTLVADRLSGPHGALMMKADAALVPHVLTHKKSSSEHVRLIIHELTQAPEYEERITKRMTIQHVSGTSNVMSDLISRGLWNEFEQLCHMLRVKPSEVKLSQTEIQLVVNVLRQVDPRAAEAMEDHFNRERSAAERGIAKARPDSTDGDGPFTPPWIKARQRAEEEARKERQPRQQAIQTPNKQTQQQPQAHTPVKIHPYLNNHKGISQLGAAAESATQRLVERLTLDRTPGRIKAPPQELAELAHQVAQARADGANPRTAKKNDLAWQEWVKYAELKGFNPNLRTAWTRAFPERECLKLAGFVLYTAQTMRPRAKKDEVAKPLSINQRYLALRRIFKAQDVELPPDAAVQAVIKGLIRRYIRTYGITELRPTRVEPITPTIVKQLITQAEKGTTRVGGKRWNLQDRDCFNVTAWQVINLQVGSRKGEATKLPGDVDHNDWFTRASVTYRIAGRITTKPTRQDLLSMTEGDYAMLAPKGAKCDQWGTCHGTEPIILPFHNDGLNPAQWLTRLELKYPCDDAQRDVTPLFAQANGQPYSDSLFARLIKGSIENSLGATRARLYSPHSWRVWLASALRMAGASDARIQAFGRWLNPESIKIYSRITTNEYAHWMEKIMQVSHLDTARTNNLPIMDAADALALFSEGDTDEAALTPPPTKTTKQTPSQRNKRQQHIASNTNKRKCRPAETLNYGASKTTTGVGDINHKFPPTLKGYVTYNHRPSARPPPTERIKN